MAALAVVAAVAVAGPAVAPAGGPGTPKLRGAKHADGPFSRVVRVKVTKPRTLYVLVKSDYDQQQLATLTEGGDGPDPGDFDTKWLRGDEDITHDVQTSGYEFNLPPRGKKRFRVRVKPVVSDPGNYCLFGNVQVDEPTTGRDGPFFAINKRDVCAV